MFANFFNNMNNMFYPAKTFLSSVLNILHYDPSTYNIDELTEQMNSKEQCDLLNGSIDISEINKKLSLKNYLIHNLLIKKTNFVFKRTFANEKTKLFFEDIIIDIYQKTQEDNDNIIKLDENNKNEESSGAGGFLNNVINVVVHNLEVGFKNIIIKLYDKENKLVEYTLFISNINFKEAKDVPPIQAIEKSKYLFIHKKALYIGGILFKEKYNINDNIFFQEKNPNQNILREKNCLFYIGNEIELDIFHDNVNSFLTLSNINTPKFYFENFFNIEQIKNLYYFFVKKNEINKDVLNNIENNSEEKKKEDMDIMGFKIKKINFDIKIDLLYFILFEDKNEIIKEKKWISFEENIIKEKDITNKMIEYFNTYNTKYYIFCINNLLFKLNKKIFTVDNISLNLISQEEIKEDENNINNIKNEENIFKSKNYLQIKNFNFDSEKKELIYDNIYFEINNKLISILKLFSNDSNKINQQNNDINNINNINIKSEEKIPDNNIISTKEENNNINIIKEEEKNIFKINAKNLNIKIFIDKKIEENIDKISLNDIFKEENKYNYINFIITNLYLNNKEKNDIIYDNIELTYNDITANKSYYIIKLIDQLKTSHIEKGLNNAIGIYLNYDLYIFINPKIIKSIFDYWKNISKFINKNQEQEEIINKNNNEICDYNTEENKTININLDSIKIVFTENYENNEKIIDLKNINEQNEELPKNEIIYDENNDYICFNLNKISFKYEQNKLNTNFIFILKSFIIQDNLHKSKYKTLLSNYNFKKENEIFMNCELNILFNSNTKQLEIKPKIKISSLAIYLDQISLYYIYNTIKQINSNEENNINNNNINFINNNEEININNNKDKYVIKNIEIENFFIELNYSTNRAAKDYEIINSQLSRLFNTTSINKLKIIFQNFITEENIKLNLKESFKKIYEYYSSDMIKQISGSFVSALPLFNQIYDSIDGVFDIVREPLDKYNKNESIVDGLVFGVSSWVVKTATMFTYIGESIGNVFTFKSCTGDREEHINSGKDNSTCRYLRHLFNENNKDIEEYYFK